MRLIRKQSGRDRISFFSGIGDDVRITLDTAFQIGELLAEQKESGKGGGFFPWRNWNLPFMQKETAPPGKASGSLLKTETVSFLNDAYKILNTFDTATPDERMQVNVREILPNPFWDMEMSRMAISRIKLWAILINGIDITPYPYCIMGVRAKDGGGYQAINHHHQLAALRLLQIETVSASVLYLSDDQMKRKLTFERV